MNHYISTNVSFCILRLKGIPTSPEVFVQSNLFPKTIDLSCPQNKYVPTDLNNEDNFLTPQERTQAFILL